MLSFWVLLLAVLAAASAQNKHAPTYLAQDAYRDSDEPPHQPYQNAYGQTRSYEPSYDEPKHYQSVENPYPKPEFGGYQGHTPYSAGPHQARSYDPHASVYQLSHDKADPEVPSYDRSEDLSKQRELLTLHRPQELPSYEGLKHIAYEKSGSDHGETAGYNPPPARNEDHRYAPVSLEGPSYKPSGDEAYKDSGSQIYVQPGGYSSPAIKDGEEYRYAPSPVSSSSPHHPAPAPAPGDPKLPSYQTLRDIAYEKSGAPNHDEPDDHSLPNKDNGGYRYAPAPVRSPSSHHPAPVPVDPKLPLYFTMYEKRIIADPTDNYGKGPWRFLTYGHGITYGSKEPGKVFEKGYGYIRALGRDVCKLPERQCPPKDGKPFEYEGRKEPYFGYRPH